MSTAILHEPVIESAAVQTLKTGLEADTEKLAALRFFILLTARRGALECVDTEGHEQVENDLGWLRAQYFDMIDEIAMNHGVQQAMDAKTAVEREVTVPRVWPPVDETENQQAWF